MTGSLSRPAFVASTLAAVAIPRKVRAQTPVAIRCSSAPDDDVSSVAYAIDSGMFKKAGLDVTLTSGNSGAAIAAGVAGGALDIGKSSVVALISAHARGIPFLLVAGAALYDVKQRIVAMLVANESAISGPKDLPGKIIGVPSLNDLYSIANAAFVDRAGGAWREVKNVEMPSPSAPAALIGHRIDAATATTPVLQAAIESGKLRTIGDPFAAIADHFVRGAWFGTRDFVNANPDAIARFHRVVSESAAIINASPAKSVPAFATFSKQDPAMIARMPRSISVGKVDPKLLQPCIDAAFKYGAIAAKFNAADLIAPGADR